VLLNTHVGDLRELISVFTDGVIEVCEGQSYDKEFEAAPQVSEAQYLMMIGKKTGWLVAISAHLGAIIGGATPAQTQALLAYARHIGRAFQVQDDLLDAVAEEEEFGKPVGADILEGKKTYLLVTAMDRAEGEDLALLRRVATRQEPREDLVPRIRALYRRMGILDLARQRIEEDTAAAIRALDALPATEGRGMLVWLAHMLLDRKH
jgi:geranylgeranyl diphosphate synthase type II